MAGVALGAISTSAAAGAALTRSGVALSALLARHRAGDWGDEEPHRRAANDFQAERGLPVISRYPLPDGSVVHVVTAADRSATRVLLPEEAEAVEVSAAEGYALWSESYDTELNQLIVVEQACVDGILAGLPVRSVLDAATGTGRHALTLARRGAEVTAFDASAEMLAVARARAGAERLAVTFQEASLLEPLPFPAARFDLVLCALAFCHLPDIRTPCQEFARVTRPGGRLLVTDFHPDAFALGWRTEAWQGATRYRLTNHAHSRAEYIAAVEDAGFAVQEVRDITIAELPPQASHLAQRQRHGHVRFCLVVHAERR